MPKKVSESEKKEILDSFSKGYPIKELSEIYNYSIQTITRQLKLILGDAEYKKIKLQFDQNKELYEEMLEAGIAKECARFVLPLATPTRIYMTGSCRSWIHYINLRSGHGTQKEHIIYTELETQQFHYLGKVHLLI